MGNWGAQWLRRFLKLTGQRGQEEGYEHRHPDFRASVFMTIPELLNFMGPVTHQRRHSYQWGSGCLSKLLPKREDTSLLSVVLGVKQKSQDTHGSSLIGLHPQPGKILLWYFLCRYTVPSADMCAMSQPTQPQVISLCAHIGRFTLWIKLRALHSLVWVSLGASRVFPAEPIVLVYKQNSECFIWGWRLAYWSSWANRLGDL